MSSVTERAFIRQTRHLAFIAEFTTDIRYVKGETNFVADALSRPSVSAIHDGPAIDYKELSLDQAKDTEFTCLRHSTSLCTCSHHMVIIRTRNKITDFLMILAWASPFKKYH